MTSVRIGIDTGGTFTDLIAFDASDGTVSSRKVASTPAAPLRAFLGAIEASGVAAGDISFLVHGTTVATNAMIQRAGARVGFICTAGHEDIPYIQRVNRQYLYDLTWNKPRPLLASRRDCFGVAERITADGEVLTPLTAEAIDDLCERLAANGELEALAVCLLFSYLRTDHEAALAAALRERFGDLPLSVSHEVAPIWREYERSSTTIADAYIKPLIQGYVASLADGLAEADIDVNWAMMKSNGGLMKAEAAADHPIHLAMSGPAGGAVASRHVAGLLGLENVVTIDVGGTSADVALVLGGDVGYTTSYEVEWGIPAAIPLMDIHTVGAGGGSIAYLNAGGFLQVGPQSAGAVPGPVCYGAGGQQVTLTDANLVLGRLDPDYFCGGAMRLDEDLARRATAEMAARLDMSPLEFAHAVVEIADENMANAIRMVSIDRGHDPRHFALLAFGGAGPLHGAAVARKLHIPTLVVPPFPGSFSALGLLLGDLRVDKLWTQSFRSDRVGPAEVAERFATIARAATEELRAQGFEGDRELRYAINMRYLGQNYETEVEVPPIDALDADGAAAQLELAYAAFHDRHRAMYEYVIADAVIEMVSFRVSAIGAIAHPRLARVQPESGHAEAARQVYFRGDGLVDCRVTHRRALPLDEALEGPLIVSEEGSTTLVEPGMRVRRTPEDVLIVEVGT
ncbi:MAG: hydantoinase/oxoprolinase family protein [bacterium]|nr:hydantoinase/oxoprolinase family protein [bacterium]